MDAFLLDMVDYRPFLIMTSNLPGKDTRPWKMLMLARKVVFEVICVFDERDRNRLAGYTDLDQDALRLELERRAASDPVATV